jgi:lipid A disaccharide synthetase
MVQEQAISCITIQKVESRCLVIEVPVASLPNSLRSGEVIAEEIKVLCEKAKRERLVRKLERFLERAHEAEEKRDYFRAGRAFVLALLCEGRLRPEVTDPCGYVRNAMPVY